MAKKEYKSIKFWCQKVLPLVYDESLSYYEVLCKTANYVNNLIKDVKAFNEKLDGYDLEIDDVKADVAELQIELEKVKNGEYSEMYIRIINEWLDNNAPAIIHRIVKYIFFGLSNDGYFCAYVPPSWDFISFDTIMTYDDDLYGHLVLNW